MSKIEVERPKIVEPIVSRSPTEEISQVLNEKEISTSSKSVDSNEIEMQNERKERARLFMEQILKQKLAAKNKQGEAEKEPPVERPESREKDLLDEDERERIRKQSEPAKVVREIKPDVISGIISQQIEKALPSFNPLSPAVLASEKKDKPRKEKKEKHRSKKRRHRRSSSSGSEESNRRRRRKRNRSRRLVFDFHVKKLFSSSRSSSHSSHRSSRKSKRRSRSRSKH